MVTVKCREWSSGEAVKVTDDFLVEQVAMVMRPFLRPHSKPGAAVSSVFQSQVLQVSDVASTQHPGIRCGVCTTPSSVCAGILVNLPLTQLLELPCGRE